MNPLTDYEEQVYAGVLGKVIGVYMGRPFEGWTKRRIEERWGQIDRYVHEDLDKPLVVPDDDISGTLTFVRALEDSARFGETPVEFFGDTWLNYLIEGKTVLWWGGMGHSTEHTAYLRLKHGMRAPRSGALATNGGTVAEQIGAQIFIDAFGMIAPGRPEWAAALASRSASVSHGGEAVYAARVVAGMVSAAFVENDIDRLLDIGISLVPENSLIARVHRDVRDWCEHDGDWRTTYGRIVDRYGYKHYGGNCHVVPNHAVMVMAWCYGRNDFHRAQCIVNTAGWDTDCNAGNVGTVMGIVVGLEHLCDAYDFRQPFADRVILPTAEGTRGVTDCLIEALHLSRIGRRVMGWPECPAPKAGAWHHFSLPGALHGWLPEEGDFATRGSALAVNATVPGEEELALCVTYRTSAGRWARVSTPVLPPPSAGGYGVQATPRLYPGMRVSATCVSRPLEGDADARLYVRYTATSAGESMAFGPAVPLSAGNRVDVELRIPSCNGLPVADIGIEVRSARRASGDLFCTQVRYSGMPDLHWPDGPPRVGGEYPGWIMDADVRRGPFSDDAEAVQYIGKNEGRGVLVTGTTDWRDYTFSADVSVHLADLAGIVVRYQGLERYIALVQVDNSLRLIRRWYGADEVLAQQACCRWEPDICHALALVCDGDRVSAWVDGTVTLRTTIRMPDRGGAGVVFANGLIGFRQIRVQQLASGGGGPVVLSEQSSARVPGRRRSEC